MKFNPISGDPMQRNDFLHNYFGKILRGDTTILSAALHARIHERQPQHVSCTQICFILNSFLVFPYLFMSKQLVSKVGTRIR